MKRLKYTTESFIKKAKEIHGDKYDYSITVYSYMLEKIFIKCKKHGLFKQRATNHIRGNGCPKCSNPNYSPKFSWTKEKFIKKCEELWNNKYDYSLIDENIILKESDIKIIDKNDGLIYLQKSYSHRIGKKPTLMCVESVLEKLKKINGDLYSYDFFTKKIIGSTRKIKIIDNLTGDVFVKEIRHLLIGELPRKVTLNRFKLRSNKIHNNKYDYKLIKKFENLYEEVEIICPDHGIFKQSAFKHIIGHGCHECGKITNSWTLQEFKNAANKIHMNVYNYDLVKFNTISDKIKIICPEHGLFTQRVDSHLNGHMCKFCSLRNSRGEFLIKTYAEKNNHEFFHNHTFPDCKHKGLLFFDFYFPKYNMCIEFDGIQHFEINKYFGGEKSFEDQKIRDEIKNEYCIKNNIKLIRINFKEITKISEILNLIFIKNNMETLTK